MILNKKLLFISLLLAPFFLKGQAYSQLGTDIDGAVASDEFGYSVSLDSDGDVVAIGSYKHDGNKGTVRIYGYSSGSWSQLGSDIDGSATNDYSAISISLDSDGDVVAIASNRHDSNKGTVRIYGYSSGSWSQLGSDIDGDSGDYAGRSVSLDSDGDVVAIGSINHDGNKGTVRIYGYSSGSWSQLGSDIDGEASGDYSGYSVSLDSDGDRLAIGAYLNDGGATDAGHVRIYAYSSSSWSQLGSDINGESSYDFSGWSVSLDSDGDRLAVGAFANDGGGADAGHVRIYGYSSGSWSQLGSDIDGEGSGDNSGYSVSLDSDGDRVAIGAIGDDDGGSNAGHVRVYEYDSTAPSAPSGLAVSSYYQGASLSWTANSESDLAKYYVYTSTDNSTYTKYSTEPTTNSISISDLTGGTKYYYKISAVDNASNESTKSSAVSITASRTWWVDSKDGDDDNDGKASASSFKTIQKAIESNNSNLTSGDTIKVKPSLASDGTLSYYDFGGDVITSSKTFVLISRGGPDSTILDAEGKNRHLYFNGSQDTTHQIVGFTFRNGKEEYNGGSIYLGSGVGPVFRDCVFKDNLAENTDGYSEGGAIYTQYPNSNALMTKTVRFYRCKFIGNQSKAKQEAKGGAIFIQNEVEFTNCLFDNNGAIGGINIGANDCCGNAYGGAIWAQIQYYNNSDNSYIGGKATFKNCTFVDNYVETKEENRSADGAAIHAGWGNDRKIYMLNTIIWGSRSIQNGSDWAGVPANQLHVDVDDGTNHKFIVNYSNIENSTGRNFDDTHIYDITPGFKDSDNSDFSLDDASPLIGTGLATWTEEGIVAPTKDMNKITRGTVPDIGAYENALSSSTAPLPVTQIKGVPVTEGAKLTWSPNKVSLISSDNATDIKRYEVFQDKNGDFSVVDSTTDTIAVIKGLTNGSSYNFKVRAINTSDAASIFSDTIKVTPEFLGPKWYVSTSGISTNTGSSTAPLNSISTAMEKAVAGDTIVVLKGTHSGSSNRGIDFDGLKPLVIMGDPDYPADSTILDAGGRDLHFVFNNSEDSTYQIVGLTLYNGKAERGGSVYISSRSNPVFKKVIFRSNVHNDYERWHGGGAVNMQWASASFYDCIFDGNILDRTNSDNNNSARGGAIFSQDHYQGEPITRIVRCIFKNNIAKSNRGAYGGAISINYAPFHIVNSLFYNNTAHSNYNNATQSYGSHGAAIYSYGLRSYDNSISDGVSGEGRIINSTIVDNHIKSDNANSGGHYGAGVYVQGSDSAEKLYAFNNIVWGSTSSQQSIDEPNLDAYIDNLTLINDYNNIKGKSNDASRGDHSPVIDPGFVNASAGDYSLSEASHLIGAGTATFDGVSAPTNDILGNVRPNPSGTNIDIGAYESALGASPYPSPVKNVVAESFGGGVNLTWNPNTEKDISYYLVAASTVSGFSPTEADTVGRTSDSTYSVTGLINNTQYYFRVKAVNNSNQSGLYSAEIMAKPFFAGPIWYVATDGSDLNEGSENSPMASLTYAIGAAQEGHTIKLKAGTYKGSDFKVTLGQKNINIEGESPEFTIIDGENNESIFRIDQGTFKISNMTLKNGRNEWNGGAVEAYNANVEFNNVIFQENNARQGGAVFGNCYEDQTDCSYKFNDCQFFGNVAEYKTNNEGNNWGGSGGAVFGYAYIPGTPYEFNRCIFIDNKAEAKKSSSGSGGAIRVSGGVNIINSLFFNNAAVNYDAFCEEFTNEDGSTYTNCSNLYGGAAFLWSAWWNNDIEEWVGNESSVINSTFVGNGFFLDGDEGNVHYSTAIGMDGSFVQGSKTNTKIVLFNNIFYGNESEDLINGSRENNLDIHAYSGVGDGAQDVSDLYFIAHNLIENLDDYQNTWMNIMMSDDSNFDAYPGFKSLEDNLDFSLNSFSNAIEKGALEFEGFSAPLVDITGKARPIPPDSPPDVGAYEEGLGFNVVFSPDSGVVDSGEEVELNLTVKDWNGVPIQDGTSITWEVTPDDIGVTVKSGDSAINNGEAKVTVKVGSQVTAGTQFRVVVLLNGEIPIESKSFFVEEKIEAPPPAPENISISPKGWTPENSFTIEWDNPDWVYALNGAWLKVDNDSEAQFFPDENSIEGIDGFSLSENGEYIIKVWLQDEFQQSDEENSSEVIAKWDNEAPYDFNLISPSGWYSAGDTTLFEWETSGDETSGLVAYELHVGNQSYGFNPNNANNKKMIAAISGNIPEQNIKWYVEAIDSAGNIKTSPELLLKVDKTPPTLTHNTVSTATLAQTIEISASAQDNRSGINSLDLWYRVGGDIVWQGPYDIRSDNYSISSTEVTTEGLSYYIEASDRAGNMTKSPAEGAYDVIVTIPGAGQLSDARWPSGVPSGKEVSNYQLISFPIIPDNANAQAILEDDLGAYDNTIWRFYGYTGGGNYSEYPSVNIKPGLSYFLITTQEDVVIDTEAGRTASISKPFEVSLNTGDWTLIGNPFDFPISLDRITTDDGIRLSEDSNVYTYNGDWKSASSIQPWEGIAFKSLSSTRLFIEPPNSSISLAREGRNVLTEGEWIVDITVNNGFGTDNLNQVGIKHSAKDGYDPLDSYEPPMLPGGVSLRMPHDDWEENNDIYSKDIRSFTEEGQVWDIEVVSGDPDFNTWITFDGLESIPEDFEIFLIDKTTKTAQNLKWKPEYLFDVVSPNSVRKLRFAAGKRDYVESNSAGIDLFPDEYSLSQNFPNPFNAQTSLIIALRDDAVIDLEIYNLLGERVAVMAKSESRPSGYYTFIWNGRDRYGNPVASGVYLAYGRIKGANGKTIKSQSRKLLLVK